MIFSVIAEQFCGFWQDPHCLSSNPEKYLITSLDLLNDEAETVTRKYITQHHTTVNINYFKLHLALVILCGCNLLVFPNARATN